MVRRILLSAAVLFVSIFTPLQADATSGTYAALGDSVAAGAGLSGGTAPCFQSPESYGYTVSNMTGLPFHHLACTGAKADDGLYGDQERDGFILPAQLKQAFEGGTPSLISITIGANDARWTQFIRQCYYITCGYDIDTARYAAYLADLKLELNVIMAKIHTLSSGTPPQVIVTGYYQPLSTTVCNDTAGLTTNEISWLRARTNALNNAISGTVAKYSYAKYAPVDFAGHELCSNDPWIQSPAQGAPFHPTAAGQAAIANAVFEKYTNPAPPVETHSYRERLLDWFRQYGDW